MKVVVQKRLAVRHPDGWIEEIHGDPETVLEATLTVLEYAILRAKAVGGVVMSSTRTVETSDWTPWN